MDVLSAAVGLMSLVLGGFAIWLSVHFYEKAKDAEKQTALALEAIRTQGDSLQKLTARWMDRFTRHATEPKPADEGLLALVSAVADLPTTILTTLRIAPVADSAQLEPLRRELLDSYIALYYYTALTNVAMQGNLPAATDYNESNEVHVAVRRMIDGSAADFTHMANSLGTVDGSQLNASRLAGLLIEARDVWRPLVRSADQAFRNKEGDAPPPSSPPAG